MKICKNCGYCGNEKSITKGSFGTEIILWLLGLLTFGIVLLIAIPYSIWRMCSKTKACPKCGAQNMIPLDTPAGKELAERFGINNKKEIPAETAQSAQQATSAENIARTYGAK